MIREREEVQFLPSELLDKISRLLPDESTLESISSFYAVFSDITRIRIISALAIRAMCVTDLADVLCQNQSTISHQLRLLHSEGIVARRREGKMILYYIDNVLIDDVMSIGIENMHRVVVGR